MRATPPRIHTLGMKGGLLLRAAPGRSRVIEAGFTSVCKLSLGMTFLGRMDPTRACLPREGNFDRTHLLATIVRGIFLPPQNIRSETLHQPHLDPGHQFHPATWYRFCIRTRRSVSFHHSSMAMSPKLQCASKNLPSLEVNSVYPSFVQDGRKANIYPGHFTVW